MKLFHILAESSESNNLEIKIVAPENLLFSDLHKALQKALDFDPRQLSSFYLTDVVGRRSQEISLMDMGGHTALLMDQTHLSDCINHKNQSFDYIFDFFSDRGLNMMVEKIEEASTSRFSIDVIGEIPRQILIAAGTDDFMSEFDDPSELGFTEQYAEDFDDDEMEKDPFDEEDNEFGEDSDEFGGSDDYDRY